MYINSIGTAHPPQSWSQEQCWDAIQASPYATSLRPGSIAILKKVLLGDSGIERRHFSLEGLMQVFEDDPDSLHERYSRWAPALLEKASRDALSENGVAPGEIDGVIVSTCTGYLCPGLTGYLAESLGLDPSVVFVDLVGHGCGAALPNLSLGASLIASGQCRRILSCCVEICSAAFYLDDDPGVLISACLFADGASATILSDLPLHTSGHLKWGQFVTHLDPSRREALRFKSSRGLLKNILSPAVPGLAAGGCRILLSELERKHGITMDEISGWVFHAGGKKVLEAIENELQLESRQLAHSYQVLRDAGNMSSPSVIFALKNMIHSSPPAGLWFLSSFGAGLSSFGATLEWTP